MNDRMEPTQPLFEPDRAPDHGPDFWSNLDDALRSEAAATAPTAEGADLNVTQPLPSVPPVPSVVTELPARPAPADQQSSRRLWPLAAAAAVLAIIGLGALIFRSPAEPDFETEVASQDVADSDGALAEPPGSDPAAAEPGPDPDEDSAPNPAPATTSENVEPSEQAPAATATPTPRVYPEAPGVAPADQYPSFDGGLPDNALFLGTWDTQRLSWYTASADADCTDGRHGEFFLVSNTTTKPIRDPQLGFSGDISHFSFDPRRAEAAWLVSCGTQLEFYVAQVGPFGEFESVHLAWFGAGQPDGAFVLWDGGSVSLNAVSVDGTPFFVDVDPDMRTAVGTGAIDLAGGPIRTGAWPLAVTADGRFSYWASTSESASGRCGAETELWLRDSENRWTPALVDSSLTLNPVDAMAIGNAAPQVAFSDSCRGAEGRVRFGVLQPDGRIGELTDVDLAPFAPGSATGLYWSELDDVHIDIDGSLYGIDPLTFVYQFNLARDGGLMLNAG